jgi:hypothetical protein
VEQAEQAAAVRRAFGIFFWALLAGLLIAAVVRYFV